MLEVNVKEIEALEKSIKRREGLIVRRLGDSSGFNVHANKSDGGVEGGYTCEPLIGSIRYADDSKAITVTEKPATGDADERREHVEDIKSMLRPLAEQIESEFGLKVTYVKRNNY